MLSFDVNYRTYEGSNDITILEKSVTELPGAVYLKDPANNLQTFSVTYTKPYKANGLTDVNLQP